MIILLVSALENGWRAVLPLFDDTVMAAAA
jgi:hypothetical protein